MHSQDYSGESIICPSADIGDVSIQVAISSISAVKLNEKPPTGELIFDVGAKLEEKERKSGKVTVIFVLTVGTKPTVAKFGVEGLATLTGKDSEIEKLLEIDPETKIPRMLYGVYQRVFMALYLVSTILETPYPPPDLFHSPKQPTPKVEISSASATPLGQVADEPAAAGTEAKQ
jgi:hypothetical protein